MKKIKDISKKHFDEIAGDYNSSYDGKFVKSMYEELVERVVSKNPQTLLDVGCGNGNVLNLLKDKTNAALYGIDLSENMIHAAKAQLGDSVECIVGDAEYLPYENEQFDVVICNASFHHYPHPEQVLKEIRRVLKKDGVFILGDPTVPFAIFLKVMNFTLRWFPTGDFHLYGKEEIHSLLEKMGFHTSDWKKIGLRTFIINAQRTSQES